MKRTMKNIIWQIKCFFWIHKYTDKDKKWNLILGGRCERCNAKYVLADPSDSLGFFIPTGYWIKDK